ncbi:MULTISPECIES: CoA pyrophosphatase [unclassified Legionella]|uniref:NUDIX hydrolase n=1 Tax=unclassified Legionella TaxID=2622702 RepID=UPI001054C439|nr:MULTISPECIES: CoA pyrophosphatase [unclassified Legionella]MDI9818903.1 CoA pyrophosphatase [Legionella sp. PL877]
MKKEAAVLVLHDLSSDTLILTQRSLNLKNHPGEVCFPGGRWQQGDEDLLATALRELEEELAIEPSRVQLQKSLTPEHSLTGFTIYPWLASIASLIPYYPDSNEVANVFSLPINEVKNPSYYQETLITRYGFNFKSCQYIASPYFIWGVTARIMRQLSEI